MLDDQHRAAGVGLDPAQQRAERLGLPLGDTGRRLVEQQHGRVLGQDAGQLDDAAGAGRQLAEELVAEGAEAQQLDERLDPPGEVGLRLVGGRQVQGGGHRLLVGQVPLEGDGEGLPGGQRREQQGLLERPAEPGPGPLVRRLAGDVPAPQLDRPGVVGRKPEMQSNSVVLPAPLWPMRPRISPGARSRSTSSTALIPPKRLTIPRQDEEDGGVVGHRGRRQRSPLPCRPSGPGG